MNAGSSPATAATQKGPGLTPFVISPPFGTYIRHHLADSVLGSFTLMRRPGRTLKVAQFVLDNIRFPVSGGWRNRIELRNPGVASIDWLTDRYIYSVVGLEDYDWEATFDLLGERSDHPVDYRAAIELNLGCQNVHRYSICRATLGRYCDYYRVIAKLPADMTRALDMAEQCVEAGVAYLHAGNTVLDNPGSLSGYPAKAANLPIVEELAKRYPGTPIIGGGGIYQFQDLVDYRNAGARRYSLATVWFRVWRALSIISQYRTRYLKEDGYALLNPT